MLLGFVTGKRPCHYLKGWSWVLSGDSRRSPVRGCTTTPTGPRGGAGPAASAEGRQPDKLASVPWLTVLAPLMPQVTAAHVAQAMEAEIAHCRSSVAAVATG